MRIARYHASAIARISALVYGLPMFQVRQPNSFFILLCMILAWSGGCGWLGPGRVSETNDPHYRLGLNRKNSGNVDGAIAAFEKALQTNPYSAAAHAELGWIYYQDRNDPAAAIFHFRKFEQFSQDKNKAEFIGTYIESCKQQLAREVTLVPVNDAKLLDEFNQLNEKKNELIDQNLKLRAEITRLNSQLEEMAQRQRRASSAAQQEIAAANTLTMGSSSQTSEQSSVLNRPSTRRFSPPTNRSTTPSVRTYTIQKRDNFYSIGRRFNISVNAIQAANPSVNPKRLQPGQVINLPAR